MDTANMNKASSAATATNSEADIVGFKETPPDATFPEQKRDEEAQQHVSSDDQKHFDQDDGFETTCPTNAVLEWEQTRKEQDGMEGQFVSSQDTKDVETKTVERNLKQKRNRSNKRRATKRKERVTIEEKYGSERSSEESAKYPADCYSFLSLHGPFKSPEYFICGLGVFFFQIAFLVLVILSVTHNIWGTTSVDDNPDDGLFADMIPANVGPLVRATQITSMLTYVIFADASIKDVIIAVHTFPRLSQAMEGDKIGCMVFSNVLRFTQGMMAMIVALLLVITSSDVIEIILNFTAINFISGLDDIAFDLAKTGKYGEKFEREAKYIEELPLPVCMYRKYQHIRYRFAIIPIGMILLMGFGFVIQRQESGQFWSTDITRVQFKDDSGLQPYNGCYMKNESAIGRVEGYRRKVYESAEYNADSAKFGYCIDERRWFLFKGNTSNACDVIKSEEDGEDIGEEIAHSAQTDAFDFSTSFREPWYSSSNTPLELYFMKGSSEEEMNCASFMDDGHCDPAFDNANYRYDGGDCCSAACTHTHCGIGAIVNAFGSDVSGDGYPHCTDPSMVALTIRLDTFISTRDQYGLGRLDETTLDKIDSFFPNYLSKHPADTLLSLYCDEKNVLTIYVDESMDGKSETVKVRDGADCIMTIENTTSSQSAWDDDPIWYFDYAVFHGELLIVKDHSATKGSSSIDVIPQCFFDKLSEYVNKKTIYTGNDPSAKAIDWLMDVDDDSENSDCEKDSFVERYALAVLNFAAPSINASDGTETMWIRPAKDCWWPNIVCIGKVESTNMDRLSLDLSFTRLAGTIASEIGLLSNLALYDAGDNDLTGPIPSEIGMLTNIADLQLDTNFLTSSIPSEIGKMTTMINLYLEENALTGPIPSEIGLVTTLAVLRLGENNLTGVVPSEIGLLTDLKQLRISGNSFGGSIPSEIASLVSLKYMLMANNTFTGSLPSEIGLLTALDKLNLDGNCIGGSIPTEIGLLTSLTEIYLANNALTGSIPSELARLVSLEKISFSNNALAGSIPSELAKLESLKTISVYDNSALDESTMPISLRDKVGGKCIICDGSDGGFDFVVSIDDDVGSLHDECSIEYERIMEQNMIITIDECNQWKDSCIVCRDKA